MAIQDIRDALVIRERDLFLLTDTAGEVPPGNTNGYGMYHRDTRYLSGYQFTFSPVKPLMLLSTAEMGYGSEHVLTNPAMIDLANRRVPRGTVQVRRLRVVEDALEERLWIVNHNSYPVELELMFQLAADFADIFEVRGYEPSQRGEARPPRWDGATLTMSYEGRDGRTRQTVVRFSSPPAATQTEVDGACALFRVSLAPQEETSISLVICVDGRLETRTGERAGIAAGRYRSWLGGATRISSDNAFLDTVIERSLGDLRMLWNDDGAGPGYPAAGTPWFDTLFGRDTAIVGMQTLAFKPEIARDGLASLARYQGKKFDSWRDEEPGKVLHELRQGELTQTGELPFSPYYGSIDSTPLFLWLAGEYYEWTGDLELLSQLETNLRAGLHWLRHYGDMNGDGYIEYEKRSSKGLVNQGWKDSADALIHKDGGSIQPPIALVEVQAYSYAAQLKLAPVFEALGDGETAVALRAGAAELGRRFNRDFWVAEENCYALALDGRGRPSAAVTSNAAHALWGGIAGSGQAAQTVKRLMAPDMFSGWGIRTLTSLSPCFNPLGYHLGTIWPHDNSIAAMGFKRYGFETELNVLASALFEAARMFPYYRLPELFAGSELSPHQTPVPYPVACRPQAWAAGSFLLMMQAVMGLRADAPNRTLSIVRPVLPPFLQRLRVEGLRVGQAAVDLLYERRGARTTARVLDVRGDLRVEKLRRWPLPGAQERRRTPAAKP